MPQEIIGPLLSIGAALELPVIGYVLLALWAVYRWAPKAFRVK